MSGAPRPPAGPPADFLEEDLLSAYLDGELPPPVRDAVAARLERDPEWRALLDDLRAVREAVRTLPTREPPAGWLDDLLGRDDGVVAAPAAGAAEPETAVVDLRPRRSWARGAVVAASVAAVLGLAAFAFPSSDPEVAPPVTQLADVHAVQASLTGDPLTQLAPLAADPEPGP